MISLRFHWRGSKYMLFKVSSFVKMVCFHNHYRHRNLKESDGKRQMPEISTIAQKCFVIPKKFMGRSYPQINNNLIKRCAIKFVRLHILGLAWPLASRGHNACGARHENAVRRLIIGLWTRIQSQCENGIDASLNASQNENWISLLLMLLLSLLSSSSLLLSLLFLLL